MSRIAPYLAIALGIAAILTALSMLVAPHNWYLTTPGVKQLGPYNHHFVIDVGLVFFASGLAWIGAVMKVEWRAPLAIMGAGWPGLHAGFHALLWITRGPPAGLSAQLTDVLGVIATGALGIALAVYFVRHSKT